MMVVVAIVGVLISGAFVGIHAVARSELRSQAFRLAGAMRNAFDRALTTGKTFRMTFDIDEDSYVLESTDRPFTILRDQPHNLLEQHEIERQKERDEKGGSPNLAGDGDVLASLFSAPTPPGAPPSTFKSSGKPIKLEKLDVAGVWTARQDKPLDAGKASLFYFPAGFCERSVVYLSDKSGETTWSIIQQPLSGRVKVENFKVEIGKDVDDRDDRGEKIQ